MRPLPASLKYHWDISNVIDTLKEEGKAEGRVEGALETAKAIALSLIKKI